MFRLGEVLDLVGRECIVLVALLAQQTPSSSELAGSFLWQSGPIEAPVACAIAPVGVVYVADAQGSLLALDASDGKVRWQVRSAGDGPLVAPAGVAVDRDGSIILTDSRRARIDRFSPDGKWLGQLGQGMGLKAPGQVAISPAGGSGTQAIAIVDGGRGGIHFCDPSGTPTGFLRAQSLLMPDGSAARPTGVAFVDADTLAISASDQDRIFIVGVNSQFGKAIGSWGTRGPFPAMFNRPMGIAYCNGWLWCADQFNHRISRADLAGKGQLAYGQHAVRPRDGAGAVHYPTAIAIATEVARSGLQGPLAVACEPFERRVQAFVPNFAAEPADMRLVLPKLEGVQSHFGSASARDGTRFFMQDPESASIVVFDLAKGPPLHVTSIGSAGSKPHEFGRIDAMVALADGTRLLVADGINRRLALWELTPTPSEIIFEPFMAKLVKTRPYSRLPIPEGSRIVSLAKGSSGELIGLCDGGPSLLLLDPSLRSATTVPVEAPGSTARAVAVSSLGDGVVGVLFDRPASLLYMRMMQGVLGEAEGTWSVTGTRELKGVAEACDLDSTPADEWLVLDSRGDAVEILSGDGSSRRIGSRGVADGEFWLPGAVSVAADGSIYVVDSGNHRAQKLSPDGQWLMTFSLGRQYTKARTADEVLRVKSRPAPTQGAPAK